eukprot:8325906-Lingulodinium_polyedra.AAC.1
MWRSRQDIWATRPAFSPAAAPLLDHYFAEHRVCVCGESPRGGRCTGSSSDRGAVRRARTVSPT